MRKLLKNLGADKRYSFTGFVERPGIKVLNGHTQPTLLIKNLKDSDGNQLADHIWLNYTDGFKKLGILIKGDKVKFIGRVRRYKKEAIFDYDRNVVTRQESIDYGISYPSQVRLVNNSVKQPVPESNDEFIKYIRDISHDLKKAQKYLK